MRSLPKISIVIPSYNKVKYIQKTLESIVSQKYPGVEVIIQDGGSTDGTLEIIKKYAKKHPKIISWVSQKDKGQVDAINKGFSKAKGEILTFINADDVYEKGALIKIGKLFLDDPKMLWSAGKGKVIDKKGKEISKGVTKYKNLLLTLNRYSLLSMVNYFMQPSVFLSKRAYKKYGPFVGTKDYVMEYDLWLKIAKRHMPTVLADNLSLFRIAGDNISSTQSKSLLTTDLNLARKYTNSPLIIFLHRLHNAGRMFIVKIIKTKHR